MDFDRGPDRHPRHPGDEGHFAHEMLHCSNVPHHGVSLGDTVFWTVTDTGGGPSIHEGPSATGPFTPINVVHEGGDAMSLTEVPAAPGWWKLVLGHPTQRSLGSGELRDAVRERERVHRGDLDRLIHRGRTADRVRAVRVHLREPGSTSSDHSDVARR